MSEKIVNPLFGLDIEAVAVTAFSEDWPDPRRGGEGFRWLHFDLSDPTIAAWAEEKLPEVAVRALLQSETRPLCEKIDGGLVVNMRGVNLNPDSSPDDMVSLRMWLAPGTLVSGRMRNVFAVEAVRRAAERGEGPHVLGDFVAALMSELTKRIEAVSLEIEDAVDGLEEAMLSGSGLEPAEVGRYRQSTIKLRRYISPQREALDTLASVGAELLGTEPCRLIRETANRTRRSLEAIDAARDRLSAIQDHIDAQQAHALSRNSYILSIAATIFLPLGFLVGLFGANVAGMPGTTEPSAFWMLSIASVVMGVLIFLALKVLKWL